MGDVINESREECGDPGSWSATEACHQLIAPDGEIARRGGGLLLIALHACAEECGRGATRSTGGIAATNLSCGISGITGGSGGHDAECCPVKVAALRLTLRNCHGAIKGADLLNCRNRCPRSAPRFKERRHVVIIGDRQKELAHPPQGIWRIGECFAADRLNAPANLRAPFRGKSGCDGGENAELCSELQRTCGTCSGKDPLNLCANSFTREARSQWGIAPDRCGGSGLHREVEARNKPDRAQHAQRIFNKPFGRLPNGAQQTVSEVISAAMWVNDRSIGNRVGAATCAGGKPKGDRVDREVSTSEVALDARKEGDLVRAAPITTAAISAEGGDLAHHSVPSWHADGAESILIGSVWKECTQLVWRRLGGEVPICWGSPSDHIANGTTNNVGAKSCRTQCTQQISDVARDGGANRRRRGHAPLAAALSEIKRKSRHAA
jgi:hypothetical protein